ncbi:RagB/SusD family nutrient uptake outer membrane protein [Hymenobacter defluvii]|uniref:RagB/SusD family nutrient uptake outer membrane protein n=1 Tax=Hymenobacter defluvii TaxID=2054411 RepID=A0ABS3TDP8_9BACT|nr:RagB/SusD family nutrient uptake outer membrane protein [Hymenobacter defluvii]MBO3271774.1 RagB/SusD family nutrient uptake outer membrane protein [Hymenobacter defluvii]
MKIHKITTLALLGTLLVNSGCDKDLLEKVNPNTPSTEQFWQTQDDALRAMVAAYSRQQIFSNYSLYWHFATTGRSDESFTNTPDTGLNQYLVFRQVNTSDQRSQFMWNDMYSIIFRCNQVLANVPNIQMDADLKKRTLAEALYLRSMVYYDMGLLFGNIPLVLTVADANTRVPQVTQEEVYAQIIKDLTAAKADLPLTYDAANKGRATRGAATALMGKVYMQMKQPQWALASEQFAEVINSNQYSLVANYADNFTEANENNSESIYEVQFSGVNQNFDQDRPGGTEGNERAQFFGPPGVGFTDVEVRPWLFNEFSDKTTTGGVDPRRDATMFSAVGTPTLYGRPFGAGGLDINPNRILWRKYQNDRTRNFENFFSGINIRLIRYADVLLMQAEALNEQNKVADAVALINQVRSRVNLVPLVAGGFNQTTLRAQLRHERITELAGEGMRWGDLIRYKLFETPAGLNELKARDADFNNFIYPRNTLLPIPQTDIDVDRTLQQNPGF